MNSQSIRVAAVMVSLAAATNLAVAQSNDTQAKIKAGGQIETYNFSHPAPPLPPLPPAKHYAVIDVGEDGILYSMSGHGAALLYEDGNQEFRSWRQGIETRIGTDFACSEINSRGQVLFDHALNFDSAGVINTETGTVFPLPGSGSLSSSTYWRTQLLSDAAVVGNSVTNHYTGTFFPPVGSTLETGTWTDETGTAWSIAQDGSLGAPARLTNRSISLVPDGDHQRIKFDGVEIDVGWVNDVGDMIVVTHDEGNMRKYALLSSGNTEASSGTVIEGLPDGGQPVAINRNKVIIGVSFPTFFSEEYWWLEDDKAYSLGPRQTFGSLNNKDQVLMNDNLMILTPVRGYDSTTGEKTFSFNRTSALQLLPDGWSRPGYGWARMDDDGLIFFEGTHDGQARLGLAVPAAIAVDANRDGKITLPSEDNSDATAEYRPFRFWLNDDIDRQHTVDGNDSEEDDIGGLESTGMSRDCNEDRVMSARDLEDYARIQVVVSGITSAVTDENNPLYVGLQWTDTGDTTPAIKLVRHVEADGGTKYLTDPTTAQQQTETQGTGPAWAIHSANTNSTLLDASDTNGRFFVLPKSLFSSLSESAPKTYLLFEGVQAGKGQLRLVILKKEGGTYTKIGDGPGVWMDLKHIEDFYERWTVGDANGGLPATGAERKKITLSAAGDAIGSTAGFAYDATSPEEQKYILYVHGWNMAPWEKNRFAETAFKRLYWQGYKGRFGVFCWPTTYSFEPPLSAILDGTNYDRGEWTAWRAATPLRDLLTNLHSPSAYGNQVYVMAHSMGNVVTGEALRLASQQGVGRLVNTYVASQAAVPAHCYDGSRSEDIAAIFGFWQSIGRYFDGTTKLPNVYPDWLAGDGAAVGRRVNFYNESDYALWHDVWELNQFFKPDRPDGSAQPWYYSYEDDLGAPPKLHSSFIRFDHYNTDADPVGVQEMQLGSAASVQDRYEIMAFASESRTKAVGAAATLPLFEPVDLQSVWPADNQSVKLHDGLNYSAHKWHSAQFRSTNMRQNGYWQTLLGGNGFRLITTP